MPSAPNLIVTFPGGIGNPVGERIATSGGRRRRSSRRMGCGLMRKSRRNTRRNNRRMGCGLMRKSRRNTRRSH